MPIDANDDPVKELLNLTGGIDVSFEFIGKPDTVKNAVECLGVQGKMVQVGICNEEVELNPYRDVVLKEAELIGCSDHLRQELPFLIELARTKRLDLSKVITDRVPFEKINEGMRKLETKEDSPIRIVVFM